MVDLFHAVVFADGQTQAAVGDLVRQADGQQHMARVERAGGAGAARGGADASVIQHQQQALALDALKAHVHGAGDMVLQTAVDFAVGDLAELGKQLVAHGDDLRGVLLDVLAALLQRGRHGDDARDVLGAGTLAALLRTALDDVRQGDPAPGIQCPDALGGVELVARDGQHVDVHGLDVDGRVAGGLHGVGVEEDLLLAAESADLGDGLHGADLVVGKHDGDEAGVVPQGVLDILHADHAVLMRIQKGDLKALLLKLCQCVQHGMVLKLGRNEVLFALPGPKSGSRNNRLVVGLAAAGGEGDLLRVGVQAGGNRLTRGGEGLGGFLAEGVKAGGVSVKLRQIRHHGIQRRFADAGGCRIVGIYKHQILILSCCDYSYLPAGDYMHDIYTIKQKKIQEGGRLRRG